MKQLDHAHFLAIVVAMVFIALSLCFTWLHLTSPTDGARLGPEEPFGESAWQSDGILATPVEDTLEGLHNNDLIVAVDGVTIQFWTQTLTDFSVPRPQLKVGQLVIYSVIRNGSRMDVPIRLQTYPASAVLAKSGSLPFVVAAFLITSSFIFWRRPGERATVPLLVWSLCMGSAVISVLGGLQTSDIVGGLGFWLFKVTTVGAATLGVVSILNFAVSFPVPHPLVTRYPRAGSLLHTVPATVCVVYLLVARSQATSMLSWIVLWNATWPGLVLAYLALTVIMLVTGQLLAPPDPIARQKGRLVVLSFAVMGVLLIVFGLIPKFLLGHILFDKNILALAPLLILGAIYTAILRHRLFDIDIFINRTLVYGTLTALVVIFYGLIVGFLSEFLQSSGNFFVSLTATGLIAVLFQPLRNRLQRGVNRLMYGERDNPYAVLSRLGQRLETTLVPDAVLPTIVETVSQTFKLPYAAIALKTDDGFRVAAAYGLPKGELLHLPLIYQGETLGQLTLALRARSEEFSQADRRLLDDLAYQAGIAVHAVRLTADLQRSRERLVTAREEERRRLRRDLHDGLGPVLASLTLKLDAARNLLGRDLSGTESLLIDARAQTQTVITDVRRLVYDLRPPALDDLGLVSAIKKHIAHYSSANGLQISVDAPEPLPPLPAAVEVAVYRIALEALNNAVRHAQAQMCLIRLSVSDVLTLDIIDDGCGLQADQRAGVGLNSMRERAEELGGLCTVKPAASAGTHVSVRLPLQKG